MNTAIVRFQTGRFDIAKERPNDVNPVRGESLLIWLADQLKGTMQVPTARAVEWGWSTEVAWKGRPYRLGAWASDEEYGKHDWVLLIEKHRTLKERLLGRQKMRAADECVALILQLLRGQRDFSELTVE